MTAGAITAQRTDITAFAVLVLAVSLWSGWRCCGQSARARYGVGIAALVIGALVLFGLIDPVIAYAVICLLLASLYVVDLLQEEHARRRRVASLVPRPRVDYILGIWTAVAALSAALVIPYVFAGRSSVAALIVAACAVAMAAVAWRVASAPVQLLGGDPEAERKADRVARALKTGVTSVIAVGSVMVFASFTDQTSVAATSVERGVNVLAFSLWAGLLAWVILYACLARLHAKTS